MRRLFGFAGRFLCAYAVGVTFWVVGLERLYNDALAQVCLWVLASVESPRLTTSVRRDGAHLIAEHIAYFDDVPAQKTDTRRVHSNTPLFVALTLGTPNASKVARALWVIGGSGLLSVSHVAHLLASIHWRYALHNVGPYACSLPLEQLERLELQQLWHNPPCLHRRLMLAAESSFSTSLQRVIPCALWLPLFLRGLRSSRGAAVARTPRRVRSCAVAALGMALVGVVLLGVRHKSYTEPPPEIEGVRLGMGVVTAKEALLQRGYAWTESVRPLRSDYGLWSGFTDAWPPRLLPQSGRSRYNWIGLRITQPPGRPTIFSGCVTGIETAPSETRPERYQIETDDISAVCGNHWGIGEASASPPPPWRRRVNESSKTLVLNPPGNEAAN